MPNASSVTLLAANIDDISVDEVYDVVERKEGDVTLRNLGSGSMSLAKIMKFSVKQPSASSQYWRVRIQMVNPESYTDSSTGLVQEYFTKRSYHEYTIDKRATKAQVTALVQRDLEMLANADVQVMITECQNFY